jgi:hypothetical protein
MNGLTFGLRSKVTNSIFTLVKTCNGPSSPISFSLTQSLSCLNERLISNFGQIDDGIRELVPATTLFIRHFNNYNKSRAFRQAI